MPILDPPKRRFLYFTAPSQVVGAGMTIGIAAQKLFLDQLLFAPSFLVVFIVANNLAQANPSSLIEGQLR